MKFAELKKSLVGGTSPVYCLFGDDDFLRDYSVSLIKERTLELPELNYSVFTDVAGDREKTRNAVAALLSCPFMSEKRVVLFKNYCPDAQELTKNGLGDYLSAPSPSSVLIIESKKPSKAFGKYPAAVEVDCSSDSNLCAVFVTSEARKQGYTFDADAAATAAEYCLCDLTRLNTELGKLLGYCAETRRITLNDVNAVVNKDTEYKIYELTDYIASGKPSRAIGCLREMLDKNESEQKLFVSIYMHFRRLLHIAVSNRGDAELAEDFGVKEFAVKMSRKQAKSFSAVRLKKIVDRLAQLDLSFKSGETDISDALSNGVLHILF